MATVTIKNIYDAIIAKTANVEATLQNAATTVSNGTTLTVTGMNSIAFQVSGTFVGQIWFRGSVDGTNYDDLYVTDTIGITSKYATKKGVYRADISSYKYVYARVNDYTSGSVTVFARASTVNLAETYKRKNVELAKYTGISINASSSNSIFSNIDVSQFPIQYATIRANIAHNFKVDFQYISSSTSLDSTLGNITVIDSQTIGARLASDWIQSQGNILTVAVYNLDGASAHTYDVYLYGVR